MTAVSTRPAAPAPAPTPDAASQARRPADPFAGIGAALRLVVRRNRVRLVTWLYVVVGLFAYVAVYYRSIFDTQQSLDDFARVSDTPAIKALTGLEAAPNTMGGAVWTKIWMTCALCLMLGVAFLVTRSGRADEELGRTELLRAHMLGIHAYSTAAWLVNAALCLACGVGVAVASILLELDPDGAGVTGSLVLGASIAGVGAVALGVAAVANQVATTSRGANMIGAAVIGAFYVLRMLGDLGDGRLTWVSPIGWGQEMQPWGANRWWVLALLLGLTVVLHLVALRLEVRRDLGAGLVADRPGPARAPERWTRPLGLSLRLQRGPIIGWSVAVLLSAVLFGSVVDAMTDLLDDASSTMTDVIGGTGVDDLVALLVEIIALVVSVFAVQTALALRTDEAAGMAELQLAGAVPRARWALDRLVIPAVGSAALLVVSGALLGWSYGASTGSAGQVGSLALAALAYWPAVMVVVGVAVVLFGWAPRVAVAATWAVVGAMWVVVVVGPALRLPDWLLDALPFAATPAQPAEPFSWTPVVVLAAVAAVLVWLGVDRFRRRDVVTA
ncbi:ABC transporter permease [Cellulomonas alba]|uniref:ABC transporter permease n=1 Tax=Cellulomonas alba TaxID=3053467 RepID=A0ABT7SEH2_9CELL|nr:ABC transporter permease [Cellulomonas alba]MDM7854571.1 ABC transporter permease [Cellulomonas alba]